jgi:RNA polymerase sigma-70 factor (ECF subfamily)
MSHRGFYAWISELVRVHRHSLLAIARKEGLGAEDAVDAVQDAYATFLTLPLARNIACDADDSQRLLTVLVKNHARNARRRHFRSLPHDDISEMNPADPEPTVDQLIDRVEAHVRALGCVNKLAETQRLVVTLRLLEERPGEDVAQHLGTTPGNIAVLLHRAKQSLKLCIAQDDLA